MADYATIISSKALSGLLLQHVCMDLPTNLAKAKFQRSFKGSLDAQL